MKRERMQGRQEFGRTWSQAARILIPIESHKTPRFGCQTVRLWKSSRRLDDPTARAGNKVSLFFANQLKNILGYIKLFNRNKEYLGEQLDWEIHNSSLEIRNKSCNVVLPLQIFLFLVLNKSAMGFEAFEKVVQNKLSSGGGETIYHR